VPKVGGLMNGTIDDLIDFLLFEKGKDIKVNGVSQRAIITEANEKIAQNADKYIHCKFTIQTGDIIEYDNKKYIITSQIIKSTNSYCARLEQCTYNIAFNFKGKIERFDAFIETKVMDIETNQFMSLPSGKIIVYLRENTYSKSIALRQRFINTGQAWEVTGIDRSALGLVKLYCDLTTTAKDDDLVNEIAGYLKYARSYTLSIANKQPVGIIKGGTTQLVFVSTDGNSTVKELPKLVCSSSDTTIALVTDTGLITGITEGNAVINCYMADYPEVSMQAIIRISETVADSYSISISGKAEVSIGGLYYTYMASVYKNGIEVGDKSVVWSISNEDDSTEAKVRIHSYTETTCRLIAIDSKDNLWETIILKATLSDDSSVYGEQRIKLISLI